MPTPDKTEAFMNGWKAHLNSGKDCVNPYNDDTQAYSFSQWESGWCARFDAVKHGLDLSLDEVY